MVRNSNIGLRLTPELREKLNLATKTKGVDISKFVRSALEKELAQNAH